ncbi:MAG TPA: hypothetical protein VN811_14450 [Thermoanaerobaculia bacterium]|nr:hypothetical protein [Thermoanaerobaculia bacterium]
MHPLGAPVGRREQRRQALVYALAEGPQPLAKRCREPCLVAT